MLPDTITSSQPLTSEEQLHIRSFHLVVESAREGDEDAQRQAAILLNGDKYNQLS